MGAVDRKTKLYLEHLPDNAINRDQLGILVCVSLLFMTKVWSLDSTFFNKILSLL